MCKNKLLKTVKTITTLVQHDYGREKSNTKRRKNRGPDPARGLGKGKSAYAIFTLVELLINVFDLAERKAWELVKGFLCFHPEQFFDKLKWIRDEGLERVPVIIWDDAGLWLHALE
jgi:hypothetical protein